MRVSVERSTKQSARKRWCMQSETVTKSRDSKVPRRGRGEQGLEGPRTEYVFDVNTNEMRCDCPRRENLEDKFVRRQGRDAGHHEEVQGRELRGQENLKWNTDLIEAMELEHVVSQDAQDLGDGETRHESRQTREHQFNEKRLASSTIRPHEPRRYA